MNALGGDSEAVTILPPLPSGSVPKEVEADLRARTRSLDALLRAAAQEFSLLFLATLERESGDHARIVNAFASGSAAEPRGSAPPLARGRLLALRGEVDAAARAIDERTGWLAVYRDRLEELGAELALVDALFTPEVNGRAALRFPDQHPLADRLAEEFVRAIPDDEEDERIATDDLRDPMSLISQMRARLGFEHLRSVRVLVRPRVGALAAAGDGVVVIAKARMTTAREAYRVVLHEVDGHVLPRERGRRHPLGIATLGSAGTNEDEEGRALCLETADAMLDGRRRRTLGARHIAARMVVDGAEFVDVVRGLASRGLPWEEAVSVTTRVTRGGFSDHGHLRGGIARERVYLPAMLRIGEASRRPGLLARMGAMRLSLRAFEHLE